MNARTILIAACLLGLTLPATGAAPLADKLPAKPLAYVGWAGRTAAFDASSIGKLIKEPVTGELIKAIKAAADEEAGGDEQALKALPHLWQLGEIVWPRPIAAVLTGLEIKEDDEELPKITAAAMIDLGEKKAEFAKHLDALLAIFPKKIRVQQQTTEGVTFRTVRIDKDVPPLAIGYVGNVFYACTGEGMPAALVKLPPNKTLQADAGFQARFRQVDDRDLAAGLYIDAAGLLKALKPVLGPARSEPDDEPSPRQILNAMGVGNVEAIVAGIRVLDQRIHSKLRIITPAPHRGILKLLGGGTLTAADLAGVPADADFFVAFKLQPQTVYDELRSVLRQIDPKAEKELLEGVKELEKLIEASLTKDVLPLLGDTWVISSAPSQGGFLTGTVLTVTLKNPSDFTSLLAGVEDALERAFKKERTRSREPVMMPPDLEEEATPPGVPAPRRRPPRERGPKIVRARIAGVAVRYVAFLGDDVPVAPAWAVRGNKLYVGLWPQVVAMAVNNAGKNPITNDPTFQALRQRVAPGASMMAYSNNAKIARQLYSLLLLGGTAVTNELTRELGIASRPHWLPTLPQLEKYLGTGISAYSADARGVTLESYDPIPLVGIGPGIVSILTAGFMGTADEVRFDAVKAVSASNLHQIGIAVMTYQADKNQMPADLDELVKAKMLDASVLVRPGTGKAPPQVKDGKIVGPIDYIYIKPPKLERIWNPSSHVLAYEDPANYGGSGTHVLFADGHVEWMPMPRFERALERTKAGAATKPPGATTPKPPRPPEIVE